MKNIGLIALALVAALVLGFGTRAGTQTAHAAVDGSVVIGCEFLIGGIDGDPDNVTGAGDPAAACDGISAAEVALLGDALGDEDGVLEPEDFEDIDLDDNQIEDAGTTIRVSTYAFAFVDNDEVVTFDSEAGLVVAVNDDDTGAAAPNVDANPETCAAADDTDCDVAVLGDGDGVVVATLTDGTADAGEEIDVDISQADDPDEVSVQTILVTGAPDEVTIQAILDKTTIQSSGTNTELNDCLDELDILDDDQFFEPNITVLEVNIEDSDGTELTRVVPTLDTDDADIVPIPSDAGEPGSDPSFDSGTAVNSGDTFGIGYFFAVCGGDETGTATITAIINEGDLNEDDSSIDLTVTGEPDAIALSAAPAQIACDGTATSTVTATVTDSEGNNVANGTDVRFDVVALGTANPINTDTTDGVATSVITPLSNASAGVTVIVSSGDAEASIRVDCSLPIPPTAPAGPVATPTRTGTIGGPDTGNGGYLGQDSSAGFPMWTLVALALGSVALVAGGMVTRKVSK